MAEENTWRESWPDALFAVNPTVLESLPEPPFINQRGKAAVGNWGGSWYYLHSLYVADERHFGTKYTSCWLRISEQLLFDCIAHILQHTEMRINTYIALCLRYETYEEAVQKKWA